MSGAVTPQMVLDCPMGRNDADAPTIRAYLVALARQVWIEDEGFSGKRPFGNSGWWREVYDALTTAGYLEDPENDDQAHALILSALDVLAGTS